MRKTILLSGLLLLIFTGHAQPVPGKPQPKPYFITGVIIHIGNGEVINGGVIGFSEGKINYVGTGREIRIDGENSIVIQAPGKHVYPGFIAPNSILGLSEVEAVRATLDYRESGDVNPNVRALVAYNTDSKVIPTVRNNGVLLTQIAPQGGVISGRSSVVQLDAWNWEDAAVAADEGMFVNWPSMRVIDAWWAPPAEEQEKRTAEQLLAIETFFAEAKAYVEQEKPAELNLKLEAMRDVFSGKTRLYVRVGQAKGMVSAVNYFKKLGIRPVLVGAEEAGHILEFLKAENTSLLLEQTHRLPASAGAAVDAPYTLPGKLWEAGIPFGIMVDGFWQIRNLPFHAGTLAGYGLTPEQALQTITLHTARILGIDKQYGSLEPGKSATLFISTGDALDMRSCVVTDAFIDGRKLDLTNTQKDLYKRFSDKYEGIKP